MKKYHLLAICLCAITVFSSCQRGLKISDINKMEEGFAQDSMLCYYYCGFYLNQPLHAVDTFALWKDDPEKIDKKRFDTEITIGNKSYHGEIPVLAGDTLIPTEFAVYDTGEKFNLLYGHKQKATMSRNVKLKIIRDGKEVDSGWRGYSQFTKRIAPFAWTSIFCDWDGWVLSLIIFGGLFVIPHRIWLFIFRKLKKRNGSNDVTKTLKTPKFYFIGCFLIAATCVFLAFKSAVLSSLYYNPNIFAHYSEYPFVIKLFPFVILLTIAAAVLMFIEMKKKLPIWLLVVHFIGMFAWGLMIIGLTLVASWLLYILILAVLPFIVVDFMYGGELGKMHDMQAKESEARAKIRADVHAGIHPQKKLNI